MINLRKHSAKFCLLFLVVLMIFVSLNVISSSISYANDNLLRFDGTSILDDLHGSKDANGNEFDITKYPKNEKGELKFYNFVEYGYSYYPDKQDNYALYFYLYNPQQLNFTKNIDANVIRMGVSHNGDEVTEYEDFHVRFISRTTGDYNNLFYKFKIMDPERKLLKSASEYEGKHGCRRYDVAGVFLKTAKNEVTLDKNVGHTYKCSGYMATYGKDASAPSTFVCDASKLETLDINVYQTSYLTGVSSAGAYHHNNVSSVYFGIPERVFNEYGNLYEIYAQWYECRTAPILVTSNQGFYNQALSRNHYTLQNVADNNKILLYDKNIDYYLTYGYRRDPAPNSDRVFFDWAYNLRPYSYSSMGVSAVRRADEYSYLLPYVFYSPSYEEKGAFNVINKQTVAGDVSSSVIRDYILNYGSSNFVSWHTSRNLPSELFVNEVDSARAEKGIKVGLNKVRTNLSDTFDLKSWNSEYGRWWDKLVQYGWSYPKNDALGDDHVGVKPFEEITAEKLLSGNLSRDLLINEQDVDVFKKFCNDSLNKTQKEIPYLFRFAVSDYYSRPVTRYIAGDNLSTNGSYTDTYFAQETVFFDFNIITMIFKGEESYYTLPVMHTPVDVVPGVKAPDVELTPGEHIVDKTLSAFEKFLNGLKNSEFLNVLKLIAVILLTIVFTVLLFAFLDKLVVSRFDNPWAKVGMGFVCLILAFVISASCVFLCGSAIYGSVHKLDFNSAMNAFWKNVIRR